MSKGYKKYLDSFFRATTNDVMKFFRERHGAEHGDMWVFIPGTNEPDERLLIVAHADTVHRGPPKWVEWIGTTATASTGLGADDRAGCAMAATFLLDGKHSVLILDGEESGGIGAAKAVGSKGIPDKLAEHAFALELDRMGGREVVTYGGTSSPDFDEYLSELFPRWEIGWGSYTDIATICPAIGICGANVAVGYAYQHTKHEFLDLTAWVDSLAAVRRVAELGFYPSMQPTAKRNAYLQNPHRDLYDENWLTWYRSGTQKQHYDGGGEDNWSTVRGGVPARSAECEFCGDSVDELYLEDYYQSWLCGACMDMCEEYRDPDDARDSYDPMQLDVIDDEEEWRRVWTDKLTEALCEQVSEHDPDDVL